MQEFLSVFKKGEMKPALYDGRSYHTLDIRNRSIREKPESYRYATCAY